MDVLSICANILRGVLIALAVYHIAKRWFKPLFPLLVVFVSTFLNDFLKNVCNIHIDWFGGILYLCLLVMTIYLGSTLKFYDRFVWWDKLTHGLSGVVFVSIGLAAAKTAEHLQAVHLIIFSFTFSLALHVIWELLEYITDCLFHTNHQRWQKIHDSKNHKPSSAIQPAGLVDTMNDMVWSLAGTSLACFVWWLIL